MEAIETTYDFSRDLTLVTARGGLTAEHFLDWVTEYYHDQVTTLILWNLTDADLSDLRTDEISLIALQTKNVMNALKGGKIAFVHENPLDYGVGRMLEAYMEIEEVPLTFRAFYKIDEASHWLGV